MRSTAWWRRPTSGPAMGKSGRLGTRSATELDHDGRRCRAALPTGSCSGRPPRVTSLPRRLGRGMGIELAELVAARRAMATSKSRPRSSRADGRLKDGRLVCRPCDLQVAAIDRLPLRLPRRAAFVPATRSIPRDRAHAGRAAARRGSLLSAASSGSLVRPGRVRSGRRSAGPAARRHRSSDRCRRPAPAPRPRRASSSCSSMASAGRQDRPLPGRGQPGSHAHPVVSDQADRRRTIEIRPTGRSHPDAAGLSGARRGVVVLGPSRPAWHSRYPAPINRGNPYSPPRQALPRSPLPGDAWILECGGGDRRGRRARHVNFEYLRFELADVLRRHPSPAVRRRRLRLVFSQAVFEHVRRPSMPPRSSCG